MSRNYQIQILPSLFILLFSGCASLPDNYTSLYQEAPNTLAEEQNNTRLKTIESLIQTGKDNAAKEKAELINPSELTNQQQAQFNLLCAQILLSFGDAEQAIGRLGITEFDRLTRTDQIKYYQSQAFAYSLTGNLLESAKARIALDSYLVKPTERKKNQGVILETLGLLPASAILTNQAGLAEWVDIAKILASRSQNPASFNSELARWQIANVGHPANAYLATVKKIPNNFGVTPNSIAVLLPESGSYADAAKAIKAGILAAHSRSVNKPALHFYDTETESSPNLYQQAVKDGAKLVIGPLNKDSIQALANSATLTMPVLALNHVPNLNKKNLYQFALSPMDDVAEITKKAALDGHKNAILLVPENEQSKRVSSYFMAEWQALHGIILRKIVYSPEKADFAQIINKLSSNPENVDVIFLSAYGKEGRAINAQLQAQQLGDIAVYALPTIYSGLVDSISDNPLNGITFCDTPWLFNGAYSGELSMSALRDTWKQFPATYIRLVAMGIDAYQLTEKLTTLGTTPYSGATGNLSLAIGNRIKRSLVCAKFAAGQPELIGFSHSPIEGDYSGAGKPIASTPTIIKP